ncbi:hypothetical protein GQ55_2G062500 [Panicum hallii var. hallii]|uniref:Uncharacterized protein n=1 Tax=Panicum hallii var. hallii TaxID=1504633 RepID=A0A2T7EM12_9POAL|nr:hypothetical protein GQ55_2G062500 [Panicum hallii var. hallii]
MARLRPHHPLPRALGAARQARPLRHLRLRPEEPRQAEARRPGGQAAHPSRATAPAARRGPPGRRRVDGRRAAGEGRAPQGRLRRPRRALRRVPRRGLRRRGDRRRARQEAGLDRPRLRAALAPAYRRRAPGAVRGVLHLPRGLRRVHRPQGAQRRAPEVRGGGLHRPAAVDPFPAVPSRVPLPRGRVDRRGVAAQRLGRLRRSPRLGDDGALPAPRVPLQPRGRRPALRPPRRPLRQARPPLRPPRAARCRHKRFLGCRRRRSQ